MKKNWLVDRLTDERKSKPIWRDFIEALQSLIETHAEQYITRLKHKVSLFDADPRDLDIMLKELGDFFALGQVDDVNLPLTIMQRQDQIHQKKTIYPLVNTLIREFGGIRVEWSPLFAPIDQGLHAYGDLLVIEREIAETGIPRDQWFMTSRGVIRVPMNEVRRTFDDGLSDSDHAISQFEELLKRVIYPLIPLRIVCDGQQYFLSFDLVEIKEWMEANDSSVCDKPQEITEPNDSINDGDFCATTTPPAMDNQREAIPFPEQNRLDSWRFDSVGVDRCVFTNYLYAFLDANSDGMQFDSPLILSSGCRLEFEFILGGGGWNRYVFDGRTVDDEDLSNGWLYFHYQNGINTNINGNWLVYKNGEESTFQSLKEGDHVKIVNVAIGRNFRMNTVGNRYTWNEPLNCQWLRMSVSHSEDPQNDCEIDFVHRALSAPNNVNSFYDTNGKHKMTIHDYDNANWSAIYPN